MNVPALLPEMNPAFKSLMLGLTIALTVGLISAPAHAGKCADDIKAVDDAIKGQYGGNGAWWEWFACPVCLGSELKKDAIVTKEQVKDISSKRNLAALLARDKEEHMCARVLEGPKRLLRIN